MKKHYLITIITVVYNNPKGLTDTLTTVKNQIYQNIEYIVIDGASGDKTLDVIKQNEQHISYYLSEPDNGIYDAMNKGLKYTHGDFVIFLNAGDTFVDNFVLTKVVEEIKDQNKAYFGRAKVKGINSNWLFPPLNISSPEQADIWSKKYLPNHQSIFFPRCFYQSNLYDTKFRIFGDAEYKLRYLKSHRNFEMIDIVICNFELGGISNKANNIKIIQTQWQEQIDLLKMYNPEHFIFRKYLTILKFFLKYLLNKLIYRKYYEQILLLVNKVR
ncbi:glycosyltransferase family 2 protein [Geminocystis herdmanii]|uniref:glycosyltransferase family 2 protein n=1 Tax=Geminocystis herdmanii TaxID=669359 RepID=UPI0003490D2D|nr:glycosyltransferase family 2 protein [Geminocystis herdmanii]